MNVLKEYLEKTEGEHVSAADIYEYFKSSGSNIGMTTVYRNLEKLVDRGEVAKYDLPGSDSSCFSFIGKDRKCKKPACYHLKCESCGKLIHMDCGEVSKLSDHIKEKHGFQIDVVRTIFYGLCEDCRREV